MNPKLKWFIAGSVTLNLLLLGILGGQWMHGMGGHGYWRERLEILPPERREEFQAAMQQARGEESPEMRAARDHLRDILIAPNFDPEAYRADVVSFHHTREARMQRFATAIESLALRWPVEDRRALAEMLNRPKPSERKK